MRTSCVVFLLLVFTNAPSVAAAEDADPELIQEVGFSSASPKENQ